MELRCVGPWFDPGTQPTRLPGLRKPTVLDCGRLYRLTGRLTSDRTDPCNSYPATTLRFPGPKCGFFSAIETLKGRESSTGYVPVQFYSRFDFQTGLGRDWAPLPHIN